LQPEWLNNKLPERPGKETKKSSDSKGRLQLKLLLLKEPKERRRLESDLRMSAEKERLNSRPGGSKERKRSRLLDLSKKELGRRLLPKLRLIESPERKGSLNLPLRLNNAAWLRRPELLRLVLNGSKRSKLPDSRLRRELMRSNLTAREESPSTKLNKKDSAKRPSQELNLRPRLASLEWRSFVPRLKPDASRMKKELNKLDLSGREDVRRRDLLVKRESMNFKLRPKLADWTKRKELLKPVPPSSFALGKRPLPVRPD
jgi:hypothetical protein